MKISAMPAGAGGTPGIDLGNINQGSTASAEKLAAAKAIAAGQEPEEKEIKQEATEESPDVRRIKMRTNYSTNRHDIPAAEEPKEPLELLEPQSPESPKTDEVGQTKPAAESTQYLSPERAAIAKQRRALQVKERELAEREAKMKAPPEGDYISKADLIANPLKVFEAGVTYDKLTEAILQNQNGITPEIKALREELKAFKEGVDNTFKSQEAKQEESALIQMLDEAEALAKEGDDYAMIREENAYDQVLNKIYSTYKKTGRVLDVKQVMQEIENKLFEKNLKLASIQKVRSKIAPDPVQTPPTSQGKQMKTLTNRDGASIPLDRRARAIAAMNGTLKR